MPLWHWISSFLTNRFQSVHFRWGHIQLDPHPAGSLFFQGSPVLGPLLFNLFVLDLPNYVQSFLPQYEDGTLLYRPIRSEDDIGIMQRDLDSILSWCVTNKITKCYWIITNVKSWDWVDGQGPLSQFLPTKLWILTWVLYIVISIWVF